MPIGWATAAVVGSNLLGGYLSGKSAESAAETSADAQRAAALTAAQASAFRPVGITTRFGTSQYQVETDPATGLPRLVSAGYTATPEIRALQDRLSRLYGTSLGQAEQAQALGAPLGQAAQGLFGLGSQYLATSPQAAREQFMAEQMALLDPIRQREEARLGASVFGRGRAGLNIGAMGQPELNALAQARRTQELQLASQAEQAAQQRASFGAGLFGTGAALLGTQYGLQTQALSPFLTQFGAQQGLEQAALQPLEIGANLGGRAINTAGAQSLLTGGLGAAQTRLQGALVGPTAMMQGISGFGQNYLQNQQQQRMFDYLSGLRQPTSSGFGSPQYIYGENYSPFGTSYGE